MADEASARNRQLVERYWDAHFRRDWDRMAGFFTDDAHYTDVGMDAIGATGPSEIIRRLKIGLEPLSDYKHLPGTNMIAEGDLVMTEHTEQWHFHTGEVIDHSFVSVTQLRDGRIFRWHDYSNIPNITDNARALKLVQIQFRVGSADQRAVEQRQLSLYTARTTRLHVQSEQLAQRVNLYLALGGGFDQPALEPVAAK